MIYSTAINLIPKHGMETLTPLSLSDSFVRFMFFIDLYSTEHKVKKLFNLIL